MHVGLGSCACCSWRLRLDHVRLRWWRRCGRSPVRLPQPTMHYLPLSAGMVGALGRGERRPFWRACIGGDCGGRFAARRACWGCAQRGLGALAATTALLPPSACNRCSCRASVSWRAPLPVSRVGAPGADARLMGAARPRPGPGAPCWGSWRPRASARGPAVTHARLMPPPAASTRTLTKMSAAKATGTVKW